MAGTALAEAGGCDPTSGHPESAGERGISILQHGTRRGWQ